jgi:hypothetical protein
MGNIVITISWPPCESDYNLLNVLRNLAKKHGLNSDTDPHYINYKADYTQFAADISGLWLAFGREYQYEKVKKYGRSVKKLFDDLNIKNYDICINDLPL